jgi:hypothetical protein
MDIAISEAPFTATSDRRRAAQALSFALLAGITTQSLFWRTSLGLNFVVWDLMVVGAAVSMLRRGVLRPTAWGAIVACVLLGGSLLLHESRWTYVIVVPSTLLMLAALPLLLGDGASLAGLSRVPEQLLVSLGRTPRAVAETARLPGLVVGGAMRGLVRGVLVGLPTAALFTVLLASDTEFARCLSQVEEKLGDATVFAVWSVTSAASYLVMHRVHARRATAPSGVAREDLPYREPSTSALARYQPNAAPVSVLTWAMVVGQVTLVFALFVAANLRHLFGGDAVVRAPGSVTYATYLHAGFAELLVATMLSVWLVVAGHALLLPRGPRAPGTAVPGGRLLTALEGTLLVLTGITVASCWQRLRIYEDAYGASHLRLGVAFVELAVLGVLLLTLGKVIARRWTGHAGAVLAFAMVLAVVAGGFDADAYVARTNLDRAAGGKPLDVDYLASLSADARSALDHPVVTANPALSARLRASFCGPRTGDLRSYRGLPRCRE